MTFVGEIGIPRREFLYDLDYCDLLLISRGYARRHRDQWSATRWQTYNLMAAQAGSDALRKSGIRNPTDLLRFPWEDNRPKGPVLTEKETSDLLADIQAWNDAHAAK